MARRLVLAAAWCGAILGVASLCCAADWPQFRSAHSNSVASSDGLPDPLDGKDAICWTVELPGRGPSSPIVVDGRVILTASSGYEQDRLHVLCFDARDGKKMWERQFWATGRTITHPTSAVAANTPASDGKLVFAFFSSNDLVCLDLDGNVQWLRGLAFENPRAGNDVGMASSPLVIGEMVIVQIENQGDSFAAGLDTKTGRTKWRIDRPQEAGWSSPFVLENSDPKQPAVLMLQSPGMLSAHDPTSGGQLWSYKNPCDGMPSGVGRQGIVWVPSEGVTALRPLSGGDTPEVLWKEAALKPGAASLIAADDRVYAINRAGVLSIADANTGKLLGKTRLEGAFWSTPVLVGDRLLCASHEGVLEVVRVSDQGRKAEIIGRVPLGETLQGSPAAADGAVFVRSDKHLWRVGAKRS